MMFARCFLAVMCFLVFLAIIQADTVRANGTAVPVPAQKPGSALPDGPVVLDVRSGVDPARTRLVLDMRGPRPEWQASAQTGEVRLDLGPLVWGPGITTQQGAQGLLAGWAVAQAPDADTALVLSLVPGAMIDQVFFIPGHDVRADRLVIDIVPDAGAVVAPVVAAGPPVSRPAHMPARKPGGPRELPLVVIDPGHGGVDPGAVAPGGLYEKRITLAVARKLARTLKATGRFRTALTRDDDRFIRLHERSAMARRAGAALFVSLHADSLGRGRERVRGASVYTLSETASDAESAELAARENRADIVAGVDLGREHDEVADILIDLAMRDTLNRSRVLANRLVDALEGADIRTLENAHRYAGFAVLKAPDVPSVLVEMGFISNAEDRRYLMDAVWQAQMARALTEGIVAWADNQERAGLVPVALPDQVGERN